VVLIWHILDAARKRQAVLSPEALVPDAAKILANPNTPLVVVCDRAGIAVGVMSRSDIIELLARVGTKACETSAGAVMSRPVVSCHVDQSLREVWTNMNARSLRCAPILDNEGRPQGIVHARDIARALLDEASHEEELLRDYVLGIGYQ
jgi:CBS domain-containing protein